MATLSNDQIITILKEGKEPLELESCRLHDERARFHTEQHLLNREVPFLDKYLSWVGGILDSSKHAVFKQLLQLPIETIEFTEGVFDELKKVFDAQDRFIGFEFTNPGLMPDAEEYRKKCGDLDFWHTQGFKAMQSAINSFIVVDLPMLTSPDEQNSQLPEPYFHIVDVQKVKHTHVTLRNKVEYIMFCGHNENVIYVIDDMHYRIYNKENEPVMIAEVAHDLGYTPSRPFWSTPYNNRSRIQKASPISNSLSKLDWLLFMYTSTKHSELHAGFPIEIAYEQRCSYQDDQGNTCVNGVVNYFIPGDVVGSQMIPATKPCPTCKDKQTLGAGRQLTAPAPVSNDDPNLLDGVRRVPAEVQSLEYLSKKIDNMESTIAVNMVGYVDGETREAMNQVQVKSRFQSQYSVLMDVAANFEAIHKFTIDTIFKLRYGKAYMSSTINYGKKFFLHSVEELQVVYKSSKDNGFPNFELSTQFHQIIATKYRGNPTMLERMRIMSALEPYQNYTIDQVISLNDKIGLNEEQVRLKINFESYISRFEREYMNIVQFMQFSTFETKIEFIQAKLLEYVDEDYEEEEETPPPAPPPAKPGQPPAGQTEEGEEDPTEGA